MTDNGARAALIVARTQGSYNIVTGVWPLVSMRSFEALLGPKIDHWLVKTVSGLLLSTGAVQVGADRAAVPTVRRLSVLTSVTLLAVDCTYAARGRIAKTYLIDALVQTGLIVAWLKTTARADGS